MVRYYILKLKSRQWKHNESVVPFKGEIFYWDGLTYVNLWCTAIQMLIECVRSNVLSVLYISAFYINYLH